MIICQIDARIPGMGREEVEEELALLGEVLAALDGELVGAEVSADGAGLTAYARAESELALSDIFDATPFAAERIAYLGPAAGVRLDLARPPALGNWRYRPRPQAAPGSAARPA